jgi:hypothetical protein
MLGGEEGVLICKVAISLGLPPFCVAFGRFLFAPRFLPDGADGTTSFLLAASLFTITIAALVRK